MSTPAPPYHELSPQERCTLVAYHQGVIAALDAGDPPLELSEFAPADARAFSMIEVRELRAQFRRREATTTDVRNRGSGWTA